MKLSQQDKKELYIDKLAVAFARLGYRRATTAQLAESCSVKEQILYRLWSDKKAMFIDSMEYITDNIIRIWRERLEKQPDEKLALLELLNYEAVHFGELNHYLIVFSGLNEADDPDIRQAMQKMYFRVHSFLVEQITRYRMASGITGGLDCQILAWALMGTGTMLTITKYLDMLGPSQREALLAGLGGILLGNNVSNQ